MQVTPVGEWGDRYDPCGVGTGRVSGACPTFRHSV
jgi:hypothetical protein